jgi:hypothetical protein
MPEADIFHWWKHWFVVGVIVEKLGSVQISYVFPEDMKEDSEFPNLLQRYVELRLESEYRKVEHTLAGQGVSFHLYTPNKIYSDIAAPGEERPNSKIIAQFRSAVSAFERSAPFMQPDEVSRNIELATQYFIDSMLPDGVGHSLYVRRRDSEERFEDFIERASQQLFLLAGRAGTGKTMFITRMVTKYPTFCLVYTSGGDTESITDLPQHVLEQYASIIANKLGAKGYGELDVTKLENIARSKAKSIILHVESNLSLNGLTKPDGLLYRLAKTIRGRNIKVCLSCVADVGETVSVPEEIAQMIYQPQPRQGLVTPSSVLEDYSEEEFANACLRYFGERRINLSEVDLKDEARDRLKHPLWLDIFSMARAEYPRSTRIEANIRYVEVCESFLSNRSKKAANILNIDGSERSFQLSLDQTAMEMMSVHLPSLERKTVEEIISRVFSEKEDGVGTILDAMRRAGLIKESFEGRGPESRIKFSFQEIREYLVAKRLAAEKLFPAGASAETVRGKFTEALRDQETNILSPYGLGVLEFLILLVEHAVRKQLPNVLELPHLDIQIVNQLLEDSVSSGTERGQQVCARVLGKLEEAPNDLLHFLRALSKSKHESVRRDLTYSLSSLSRETQESAIDARQLLYSLVEDPSESVACCAVGALIKSFENEVVPPDWAQRFKTIGQSPIRPLVTTMTREFGTRILLNAKEFLAEILKYLCLREKSDPHIAAVACNCLSRRCHLFPGDALKIVCGAIDDFTNTSQDDIVMREAIPALISIGPYFPAQVYLFLEGKATLKRNESVKCEIARNSCKLTPENREKLLGILENDESPIVRALVFSARLI